MGQEQTMMEARVRTLFERRCELVVKGQELCAELARLDLEILRAAGPLPVGAIAGTIGGTIAGTIGATVAGTIGATLAASPIAGTIGATIGGTIGGTVGAK